MELKDLLEARRNPDINVKEEFDFTRYFDGRFYVSFTTLPKIGIKPVAEWTTPHGVCAYPLFIPQVRGYVARGSFPFASNREYVNVITAKGNELLLSSITQTEVDQMIKLIDERYGLGREAQMLIDDAYWSVLMTTKKHQKNYWGLTTFIAIVDLIGADKLKDLELKELRHQVLIKEGRNEISVLWNKALRGLGFDLITDDVGGIIHHIEPYQTIFVNPRSLSLVERASNPLQNRKEIIDKSNKLDYILRSYKVDVANLMTHVMYSYHYPIDRKYEIFVTPSEEAGKVMGRKARESSDIHSVYDNIFMIINDMQEDFTRYGNDKLSFFKAFVREALDFQQQQWLSSKFEEQDEETQEFVKSLNLFQ